MHDRYTNEKEPFFEGLRERGYRYTGKNNEQPNFDPRTTTTTIQDRIIPRARTPGLLFVFSMHVNRSSLKNGAIPDPTREPG